MKVYLSLSKLKKIKKWNCKILCQSPTLNLYRNKYLQYSFYTFFRTILHKLTNRAKKAIMFMYEMSKCLFTFKGNIYRNMKKLTKHCSVIEFHCVKSVRIRGYSGLYSVRKIRSISPYSVWMLGNTDQNNSEYGHFLRSVSQKCSRGKHW